MRKVFLVFLPVVFIGFAKADPAANQVVAAASYVNGAVAERVYTRINKDVNNSNSGNVVTNIELENLNEDSTKKVIKVTTSNVKIPVGSSSASTYTPIWIE